MMFLNRAQAGEKLAEKIKSFHLAGPLVLAIPRGGVPVGAAMARALACPLDVIPLINIPIPWNPEASYGAAVIDGTSAFNLPLVHRLEISETELEMATGRAMEEARRRARIYRNDRPFPSLAGKTAMLVDDGLSSGYSMLAAIRFIRKEKPLSVIVAAPVASDSAYRMLSAEAGIDGLIVLVRVTERVFSLSAFYKEFTPLADEDVVRHPSSASSKSRTETQ